MPRVLLKILVNGINGKMGTEVAKLIMQDKSLHLLGGLDKYISHNLPYRVFDNVNDIIEKPNVIIDFSVPEATILLLPFAIQNNIPIVIATTGFSKMQQEEIIKASKSIPIFQSSNMSYEIAIMSKIVAQLSKVLPNSDIEIVETHHNRKKDAPSGTALMLADSINDANENNYSYNFNRSQNMERRNSKEIGFSSIRGGNIVGEHSVLFFSENETLEIKHTAYSKTIFSTGAINAAKFLVKQKIGMYGMDDICKI